jgi:hypothetical protein
MSDIDGFREMQTAGRGSMPEVRTGSVPPRVASLNHGYHWSVYLVIASASLLVAGLASDPKVAEMVRSLLALR